MSGEYLPRNLKFDGMFFIFDCICCESRVLERMNG